MLICIPKKLEKTPIFFKSIRSNRVFGDKRGGGSEKQFLYRSEKQLFVRYSYFSYVCIC